MPMAMRMSTGFRPRQRGVTLVELMIGMTVGLVASLAIIQVYSQSEVHRRSTSGTADAQQAGTLASWRLMRDLRMAGSGLQHGPTLWGCGLEMWRSGAALLPRATAWPAPFAGVFPTALTLAPIAVSQGTGTNPDSILVMAGRTGAGPAPLPASVVSDSELNTTTSVAFAPNDLVLMADMASLGPCQVGQVAATYAATAGIAAPKIVPTGAPGTAYNGPTGFASMPPMRDYALFNLGSAPSMVMYGITNNSLVQYDLMQPNGLNASTVQAENVVNLQVLYGVDDGVGGTANDNVIDRWVAPGTGDYTVAAMLAGGQGALRVKAIRIALVMRASEPSQTAGPAEVVVFPDMATTLQVRIPIAASDRMFTRQVYDLVVPLRNQWIALCAESRRAAAVPAVGTCG